MMKKIAALFAVIMILSLGLVGCGSKEKNQNITPEVTENNGSLLEKVKSEGIIRFGTEGTIPFSFDKFWLYP